MMAGPMPLFVAGMLFLSVGQRGAESAPRKAVTARLAAKWPATPLLLEASEFIAEESNEKFWQFLETVKELTIYQKGGEAKLLVFLIFNELDFMTSVFFKRSESWNWEYERKSTFFQYVKSKNSQDVVDEL